MEWLEKYGPVGIESVVYWLNSVVMISYEMALKLKAP